MAAGKIAPSPTEFEKQNSKPEWRNGKRSGFKIRRPYGLEGSSPSPGTRRNNYGFHLGSDRVGKPPPAASGTKRVLPGGAIGDQAEVRESVAVEDSHGAGERNPVPARLRNLHNGLKDPSMVMAYRVSPPLRSTTW